MVKLRKQRKGKTYKYNVNRKRLNKKLMKLPKIQCEQMENSYEAKKTMRQNLSEMGLSYDPNRSIKLPSRKNIVIDDKPSIVPKKDKTSVMKEIEAEANEPRPNVFRLPQGQVDLFCKLIDKYGYNYKKMQNDTKLNIFQDTWKQIRNKILKFQKIPEQWEPYVKSKMEIIEA